MLWQMHCGTTEKANLKPDLHLRFGELQGSAKFGAFGDREILFLLKFPFETQKLMGAEGGSRFAVILVLPQHALAEPDLHFLA